MENHYLIKCHFGFYDNITVMSVKLIIRHISQFHLI